MQINPCPSTKEVYLTFTNSIIINLYVTRIKQNDDDFSIIVGIRESEYVMAVHIEVV